MGPRKKKPKKQPFLLRFHAVVDENQDWSQKENKNPNLYCDGLEVSVDSSIDWTSLFNSHLKPEIRKNLSENYEPEDVDEMWEENFYRPFYDFGFNFFGKSPSGIKRISSTSDTIAHSLRKCP